MPYRTSTLTSKDNDHPWRRSGNGNHGVWSCTKLSRQLFRVCFVQLHHDKKGKGNRGTACLFRERVVESFKYIQTRRGGGRTPLFLQELKERHARVRSKGRHIARHSKEKTPGV